MERTTKPPELGRSTDDGDTHSDGNSIVMYPDHEGESPQWRGCARSPSGRTCDAGVQTDNVDEIFLQKCRALEELEEDISNARALRDAEAMADVEYLSSEVAQNRVELRSQRLLLETLQAQMTQVIALLAGRTQPPSPTDEGQ